MEIFFNQLGYDVIEDGKAANNRSIKIYYIKNTDGTIRWFWPYFLDEPLFLKFYTVSSLKSWALSTAIRCVFFFQLQRFFFKRRVVHYQLRKGESSIFNLRDKWAAFTGTVGPNNKMNIYYESQGRGSFIKLASTENAKNLIQRETETLGFLTKKSPQSFSVPAILLATHNGVQLNDISRESTRSSELTLAHFRALREMSKINVATQQLKHSKSWKEIQSSVSSLVAMNDERIPRRLLRKLGQLINSIDEHELIETTFSHGDFTPWNMYLCDKKLFIYDWELASDTKPYGFDLFHFIIQHGILVKHQSWKELMKELQDYLDGLFFNRSGRETNLNGLLYLKLYLIYNSTYYLQLYQQQPNWHVQVNWLLEVWEEAIGNMLSEAMTNRKLLIIDIFDFLSDKKYAAVKFFTQQPENLSNFSDIDLVIDPAAIKGFLSFLKKHPNVEECTPVTKSYMTTIHLNLKDADLLSIDLIWKVKIKGIQLMDVTSMIENAYRTSVGVKSVSEIDNVRLIGMFYGLNQAPIPQKYLPFKKVLKESNNQLDGLICGFFQGENVYGEARKELKKQAFNRGWRGIKNKVDYFIDTFRTVLFQRGMTITFSGVDGAGKSTVIEKLKYKVEKQLRKRVIVLRHRPSILPILSSWTKGKVQAEKDAATNLPRRGTNSSFISSILRFSYYYIDYLFGQLYIQVRYIWRGYVVIYDRYYFDFINDPKRSNIRLPKAIPQFGFLFILKPTFNFFLYATSEKIMSRKQELDKATIDELNQSYKEQFEELNTRMIHSKYITINNTNLEKTLDTIFYQITRKSA